MTTTAKATHMMGMIIAPPLAELRDAQNELNRERERRTPDRERLYWRQERRDAAIRALRLTGLSERDVCVAMSRLGERMTPGRIRQIVTGRTR